MALQLGQKFALWYITVQNFTRISSIQSLLFIRIVNAKCSTILCRVSKRAPATISFTIENWFFFNIAIDISLLFFCKCVTKSHTIKCYKVQNLSDHLSGKSDWDYHQTIIAAGAGHNQWCVYMFDLAWIITL